MKKLPESVKTVWLYAALITLAVEIIVFAGAFVAVRFLDWPYVQYVPLVLGIIFVMYTTIEMALIPYRYAFHSYAIYEDHIEISRGFIFRCQSTIPIARVQNVDIEQGPLLMIKDLHEISIDTSGSSHSIDAVTKEESKRIKQRVMELAMEARNAQ